MSAPVLPSIKEELSRKTMDAVSHFARKHDRSEITDNEFSIALDAIFMSVSGLVSEDFIELITTIGEELERRQSEEEIDGG